MKMISEGMIAARMLEDCFEKRKEMLLANYVKSNNCELTPYVMEILEKCNITPSIYGCISKTDHTYGKNTLTIAIAHIVLNQDIPDELHNVLAETMSDDALELLRLLEIMLRKDFP